MNEIARQGGRKPVLPASFVMPAFPAGMSPALWRAIVQVLEPHPDVALPREWSPCVREQAHTVLEQIKPLFAPAPVEVLTAFLWPIADAVEYTPTEDEFLRRVASLHMAGADVPHVVWTQDAQRNALRSFDRFPSVKAIIELVMPPAKPLVARRRALQMIAHSAD